MNNTPLEDDELFAFHQWMQLHNIPHTHVPNEIGGSTPAMKARAIKMKRMGTSKGFPDLIVLVPVVGVTGEVDCYQMAIIEMKRQKGGSVSAEQKDWLEKLELAGIPCKVCHGAEEAVDFIKNLV